MTTIDLDETTRNAILAALDERAAKLDKAITKWQASIELAKARFGQHARVAEGTQRALVWNIAALHETNMARLLVSEAGGETLAEAGAPDLPVCRCSHAHALCEPTCHRPQTLAEAVPWEPAKGYHEWQARR